MSPSTRRVRVGISGWNYPGWKGGFYPQDLPARRLLEWSGRAFNSLEINGTFYSLQRPSSFRSWAEQTPDGFVFAVKGSRFITHFKKLTDPEVALANFFASGLLLLGDKLGPILWQLPDGWRFDAERLDAFCRMLPRDTEQAAALARRHDQRVAGRAWTETDRNRPIRHALEPRDPSWFCPELVALLRRHGVALVFADTAGRFPYTEDLTADFVYARLHGAEVLYSSGYTDAQLDWWAARLQAWGQGGEPDDARHVGPERKERRKARDVFVYFDNDAWGRAPFDALRLAERLGIHWGDEEPVARDRPAAPAP